MFLSSGLLVGEAGSATLAFIKQCAATGDEEATEDAEGLDDWCTTIQGGSLGGRAELVAKFKTTDILNTTRVNVASFQGLAGL